MCYHDLFLFHLFYLSDDVLIADTCLDVKRTADTPGGTSDVCVYASTLRNFYLQPYGQASTAPAPTTQQRRILKDTRVLRAWIVSLRGGTFRNARNS